MNHSTKAALLSALVFPGVGQISVGYKKRGWSIIGLSVVFLFFIIREILQRAYSMIAEIQKTGTVINVEEISRTTSDLVNFSDNVFLNTVLILFIMGWVISIIDAYQLGKKY